MANLSIDSARARNKERARRKEEQKERNGIKHTHISDERTDIVVHK